MKTDARTNAIAPATENAWTDRVLFWLLAAALCVRPLISESFERVSLSFLPDGLEDASAAATVCLDGFVLLLGAIAWLRHPPRGLSLLLLGFLLLLAAVIVSTAAADAKRIALNAGSNLVVAAWAAGALARVLRSRRAIRVLLAAFLATGVTNAAKCYFQHSEEFEATLESWRERKAALAAEGTDVDSPMLVNYERRLLSQQAFGYLSHPNVAAACMNMSLMLALGLLGGVGLRPGLDWNRRTAALLLAAAAAGMLIVGIYLTGSNGAFVAGVCGGLLLTMMWIARAWIAGHQRAALVILVTSYAGVIGGAVGYGCLRGTLPHTSLAFRWQYWTSAARAVAEAPLTGIGRENFRAAYLRFKPPESSEEVANPHNFWVTLLTELGPLGLCAGALLLAATYRRALKTLSLDDGANLSPTSENSEKRTHARPVPRGAAGEVVHCGRVDAYMIALGVLTLHALITPLPLSVGSVFIVWCAYFAAVWTAAFIVALMLLGLADSMAAQVWVRAGLVAALSATLIHELIEFTIFTPAGAASVAVLSAAAVGWISERRERPRTWSAWRGGCAAGVAAVLLAYGVLIARPTIATQWELVRAKAELQRASSEAEAQAIVARAGGATVEISSCWDAALPQWAAQTAARSAARPGIPRDERMRWLDLAETCAEKAMRCVRNSFALESLGARIVQDRAMLTMELESLTRAEQRWRTRVIPLYPTNPFIRIAAGDLAFELWHETRDAAYARHAIENYERALAVDATRAPEVADKLPEETLVTLRLRVEELRANREALP